MGVVTFGGARLIASYFSLSLGFELAIILPAAVAYMGLGYFILGAAVRSDITQIIQRIMQREEAKYKKLKCYVLPENLSERYFADLLSR